MGRVHPSLMEKKGWRWFIVLGFLALLSASCSGPPRHSRRVYAVIDGDTVTAVDEEGGQEKIRLQGIDAPERGQPYSAASKENLSDLIYGRFVTLEGDKTDKYGRLVAKILIDGEDVCVDQVKAGLAWHYKEYQNEQNELDRALYAAAEEEARQAHRGLWQDPSPVPPWDFRHHRFEQPPEPLPPDGASGDDARLIIGNRNSRVYHRPDCPDYERTLPKNRVYFRSAEEAKKAGYRQARNCP